MLHFFSKATYHGRITDNNGIIQQQKLQSEKQRISLNYLKIFLQCVYTQVEHDLPCLFLGPQLLPDFVEAFVQVYPQAGEYFFLCYVQCLGVALPPTVITQFMCIIHNIALLLIALSLFFFFFSFILLRCLKTGGLLTQNDTAYSVILRCDLSRWMLIYSLPENHGQTHTKRRRIAHIALEIIVSV